MQTNPLVPTRTWAHAAGWHQTNPHNSHAESFRKKGKSEPPPSIIHGPSDHGLIQSPRQPTAGNKCLIQLWFHHAWDPMASPTPSPMQRANSENKSATVRQRETQVAPQFHLRSWQRVSELIDTGGSWGFGASPSRHPGSCATRAPPPSEWPACLPEGGEPGGWGWGAPPHRAQSLGSPWGRALPEAHVLEIHLGEDAARFHHSGLRKWDVFLQGL